jgi:glycosyltransferase involved in cell wall biosynthesis
MPEQGKAAYPGNPSAIFAVVVLYRMRPADSPAFRSLAQARSGGNVASVPMLLYDNGPTAMQTEDLPEGIRYEAAVRNNGLADAYNRALEIARSEGFRWLLTLDQDTTLPCNFLERMQQLAAENETNDRVGAIVPRLVDQRRVLSPMAVRFWGTRELPRGFSGVSEQETRAFNSGSLFRVRAIEEMGGFDPDFWLDYLDVNIYRRIHLQGRRVYVAADLEAEHELSVVRRADLSAERFRNILQAESAFFDLYERPIRRLALTMRLAGRIWRQARRKDKPVLRELTWEALRSRVFHSRRRRIESWRNAMERRRRISGLDAAGATAVRPAISVCMATYNGARHVKSQIESILRQLSEADEIVVVDDGSTDETSSIIEGLGDGRVRLTRHKTNQGVVRTFEDAIQRASGEILFTADQDDLWAEGRVTAVLLAFQQNPRVDVVVSDAALIDGYGQPQGGTYYQQKGRFRSGILDNLVHCSYLGCTMAFRRKILRLVLPFPPGGHVFHDLWIGTANTLCRGGTLYLDQPLVLYRRHEANATGRRRLPLRSQLRLRWDLCMALARLWLSRCRASG